MSHSQCLHSGPSSAPLLPSIDATWQEWVRVGLEWSRHVASGPAHEIPSWTMSPDTHQAMRFHSYREATPGPRWKLLFDATWAAYRSWYTAHDLDARPTLAEARGALENHMPELVPTWERLVKLTGSDSLAARMLTM